MFHLIAPSSFPFDMRFIGEVEKLFTTFGFVQTSDNRRYFFHFGTCTTKPELLKVGDSVEFVLGEDVKTHRLHAQKVRKVNRQDVLPAPPPNAAAILKTLPSAAVFVQAQTLFTVTGMVPVQSQPYNSAPTAAIMKMPHNSMPPVSTSAQFASSPAQLMLPTFPSSSVPVPMIPCTSMQMMPAAPTQTGGLVKTSSVGDVETTTVKREALRQMSFQEVQRRQQVEREAESGEANGAWDGVLFKPFMVGRNNSQDSDDGIADMDTADMGTAFRRARAAWYSVSEN